MHRGGAVILATIVLASANANAKAADAGATEDVDALLRELQAEWSSLSTQDCLIACKAYASIRRAADRICALEPGARCTEARTKADDAQRRVQAACPDCQIAAVPPKDDERRANQPAPPSPPVEAKTASTQDAESGPRRGGCASCSTPGERPNVDLGVVALGALAIARILERRKRRS